MRAILVVVALIAATAFAQDAPRKYAVISLVGDGLLIVTREAAVMRGAEKQGRQFVPLESPAIDNGAVLAVETAIKRAEPAAEVVMLATRDPALLAAQGKALEEGGGAPRIVPALAPMLSGVKATHLVLVTKYRHEAMLRVASGSVGSGWLEGVGFYVDRTKAMQNVKTGVLSKGFVSPFAYFNVALVDLASGKVIAEERVIESTTVSKPEAEDPWEALTPEEKVRYLQGLIRREMAKLVPRLLKN